MKNKINIIIIVCFVCLLMQVVATFGQEHTGPLMWNPQLSNRIPPAHSTMRTTALSLPFFDDFTDTSVYPNPALWVEDEVYVNNTMCVSPVSRGVATFDALNQQGLPWDPVNNGDYRFADSLTSQPIDLSAHSPGDSVYLSFFYQPQGYGFFPLAGDSLLVFMKISYGDWIEVWQTPGTTLQPFQQVLIPITDTLYFHSTFQFRFVNIAALNFSDADWNVDYVKLDAGRNMYDTTINDIGFSTDPSFYLNDYTSMPYRQFYANIAGERATQFFDSVHNDNIGSESVNYGYYAVASDGTVLQAPTTNGTTTIVGDYIQQLTDTVYSTTIPLPSDPYSKVEFDNVFYMQATGSSSTGTIPNDTITRKQFFDNYLAYDDGTAEQSYYLTLSPALPGEISIENHLNVPDTMRGMAIYFGRQVPAPTYKEFFIRVYSQLANVNGAAADNLLYEQQGCFPGYIDTLNHFWVYRFDTPLALPAGTFYAGIFLIAQSGDDSLYFGLDMNRIGSNHAYYNVASAWVTSWVPGAIMMRPLLGQDIKASSVPSVKQQKTLVWEVSPNPAIDKLTVDFPGDEKATYFITNVEGQHLLTGTIAPGNIVNISTLPQGMYFIGISGNGFTSEPKKFIKL